MIEGVRLPSSSSEVWRVDGPDGPTIVKRSRSDRAWQQERAAWARIAPSALLGADPTARTLRLRALPGDPGPLEPRAHGAAARWLRALHALPSDDEDPLPLEQAFARRVEALRGDGERWAPGVLDGVDPARLGGRRVLCHRDFLPGNWLWDGQILRVVDFEHTRPDHPLVDVVRLAAEVWPAHPELQAAFLDAWGPLDREALDGLLRLHAVRTLAWGHRHRDPAFIALGERLVAPFRPLRDCRGRPCRGPS